MGPRGEALAALPGFVPVALPFAFMALVLSVAIMGGCDYGTASEPRRPRDAAQLVRELSLGQTTAADVERQFGVADDRPPDGSLIYRFASTGGGGEPAPTEMETVTLRFAHGVLSKICRARS